ncbi:MAG: S1C family serine protease [Acidimicrobiia bacterium]
MTAGAMGALAAMTILAMAGAFEPDAHPVVRAAAAVPTGTDAAALATQVAPGIAAVTTAAGTASEVRGSGIIVGPHELLTTVDVVHGAAMGAPVRVAIGDGRQHAADVRAVDGVTNLALLEVPSVRMEPAQLGASPRVRAGDWIVAVGRTPTNGPWVTTGVVTATGGWLEDADGVAHPGLIATSTELAAAARGGALVDREGHIVGILATISADTDRAAAMPADMASDVAAQLASRGKASHGALGVRATDTDTGPEIAEVTASSSAARAGLQVDDSILAIDDTRTPDTATLVYELRRREAGARTELTVARGKRQLRVGVVLDDAATITPAAPAGMAPLSFAVDTGR